MESCSTPRSSGLRAVPFHPDHLRALPPARLTHSAAVIGQALADPRMRPHVLAQSRTVLCHGLPIAAWGLFPLWEGVFTSWAWMTAPCSKQAVGLIRLARQHVREAQETLGARRIQAEVSCDLPSGLRLAELIGYTLEGKLRCYGIGGTGDYWILSIVNSETTRRPARVRTS